MHEAALQADLAKQAQKEEKEKAEKEKQQIIEEKIVTLEHKKQEAEQLLKEADSMDLTENCQVVIKLPSGARIQHKFSKFAQILYVRALVLVQEETTAVDFKLHSQFPKKEYNDENELISDAFGGAKSMMLMVQSLVDDSINKGEDDSSEEDSSEDSN